MWVEIPPLAKSRAIISSSAFFIPFFRNRGDFMGGRGAGFGGSGKNKVVGLKIATKDLNGNVRFARISPIKGSKNKLLLTFDGGVGFSGNRPRQITQKGGLKAYYNKIKDNPRWKTFKVTQAQREKEIKESKIWNPNKKRIIKWEDL